jgi:hypothetical protein
MYHLFMTQQLPNSVQKPGAGPPKKFLFVSDEALIGDLAYQVKREGHEVKYYIHQKSEKDVCDGFLEKMNGGPSPTGPTS